MPGRRPLSVFTAWVALLALLLVSLAPTVSHALASRQAPAVAFWAEICSASAGQAHQIVLAPAAEEAPIPQWPGMQACPYCLLQSDSQGPLPAATAVQPFAPASFFSLPRLFYQSPQPLAVWRMAQTRAPPVFS